MISKQWNPRLEATVRTGRVALFVGAGALVFFLALAGARATGGGSLRSAQAGDAAKDAKDTADEVRALLRKGSYDEALAKLDKASADPRFEPYKAGIDSMRALAVTTKAAAEGVKKRFAALAGQTVTIPLLVGESVAGKVQDFDAKDLALRVLEAGSKDPAPTVVPVREMAAAFVQKTIACEASYDAHFGAGLVLLYARAVEAGGAELRAAAALKPIPPGVETELKQAEEGLPEVLAQACLEHANAHNAKKHYDKAFACAERLRKDLAETAYVGAHKDYVKAAWVAARAGSLQDGPLQGYFGGKVAGKRGQKVTITYGFHEPAEAQDWQPDTKSADFGSSAVNLLPGTIEVTGRVVWRGAFKGDVTLEAQVRTAGQTGGVGWYQAANANFVLYDRGPWTGWFCGVGAQPTGVTAPFALAKGTAVRGNQTFETPSHMIGRSQGNFNATDWWWASRGPGVPGAEPYKIEIAARSHRLVMGLSIKGGNAMAPIPIAAEDQQGGIAIVPFGSKITVQSVKLEGTIDPAWLDKEASERAKLEFEKP